jgi:hypothetical protein
MTAQINAEQFLDPRWRISNLYHIIDKKGRAVPFRPWEEQLEFLTDIHSRNLILKCRQRGFTTLMCIVQLDACLFIPNTRAAVIAHKLDDAKVIFRDKVRFPYENLDEGLKAALPVTQDSADTLTLANGSSFRVSTSARSGTLNWLHVSEYGKICAQFPEKAREIRTGSFPAAENGVITIESTAEGEGGDFHERSTEAQSLAERGVEPTRKDFKFFFYPWWRAKEYSLSRSNVPCSPEDTAYFESIEHDCGITLTEGQRNWWLNEERNLGGDMKREYPATPKEAFEQAIEGAIFAEHLAFAYKHNHIGSFPIDSRFPVNTFWDMGVSHGNATAVWMEQDIDNVSRFVGYYEKEGEWIDQHLRNLRAWGDEHQVTWGEHYMPHDGDRQSVWLPDGTISLMSKLGFRPKIVTRVPNKWEGIQKARRRFPQCRWDADACKVGLQRLKTYHKEWDERRGVWRDHPHHGPESNGADAYRTFAESTHAPLPGIDKNVDKHRRSYYEREDDEGSWLTY